MPNRLRTNIQRIREYTQEHKELSGAHHFLYDLHLGERVASTDFVVMGINPGETPYDWKVAPKPTEETSEYDFHAKHGRSPNSLRWLNNIKYFLSTTNVVMTECFFWSSRNGRDFQKRYGKLQNSPHLSICTELNKELISAYSPRAIVFTGISHAKWIARLYGLQHVHSITENKHKLIEHYDDGAHPWIFTKHWSGSFGFSTSQRQKTKAYLASAGRKASFL